MNMFSSSGLGVDDSQLLALWDPPPGVFSEHEGIAIQRHAPFVKTWRRISVQGTVYVGFSRSRNFDSSAVWITTGDGPRLCRVHQFIEVAACCHEDCEKELLVQIDRFERKRDHVSGAYTYSVIEDKPPEYISASSIEPQLVLLISKKSATVLSRYRGSRARYF